MRANSILYIKTKKIRAFLHNLKTSAPTCSFIVAQFTFS